MPLTRVSSMFVFTRYVVLFSRRELSLGRLYDRVRFYLRLCPSGSSPSCCWCATAAMRLLQPSRTVANRAPPHTTMRGHVQFGLDCRVTGNGAPSANFAAVRRTEPSRAEPRTGEAAGDRGAPVARLTVAAAAASALKLRNDCFATNASR